MRERLRVSNIIDGDEINFGVAETCAKDVAPDAPETIDCVVSHRKTLKG